MGVDVRTAKRAGLLHDIGKAVDHDMEGSHIQLGASLCRKYKESAVVVNAVEAHQRRRGTGMSAESHVLFRQADTISRRETGMRDAKTLEAYSNRLKPVRRHHKQFQRSREIFCRSGGQRDSSNGSS